MVKLSKKRSSPKRKTASKSKRRSSKKRAASSKAVTGYCVKCRQVRTMVKPKLVMAKNKRRMMRGKCPVCKTTMTKFVSK